MAGNMERVLRVLAERRGSDVYLSARSPILIKVNGALMQMSDQLLTPGQIRQLLAEIISEDQLRELERSGELNVGVSLPQAGLFRLSAFRQRGSLAAVFRCIPNDIPPLETLGVPDVLAQLVMEKRGLILMVGATGTGKSTTLAAMLEHRNRNQAGHILTIEDPVEFLFTHKKSVVNQREVGRDTTSLHTALRNALRQAPDVILIGEIRDGETMNAAISYALSGHLVVATLHGNNSYHAFGRILSFFPPESREAMLADLATGLKAIVSQRLLRATSGGRVPSVEVLVNTKFTAELIERGDFNGVRDAMEKSTTPGSQTFEQDLARMIRSGLVTRDEALAHADSPTNLMWRLQNDTTPINPNKGPVPKPEDVSNEATFTEISMEVEGDKPKKATLFPLLDLDN
jgi:twitching motility protein PilU